MEKLETNIKTPKRNTGLDADIIEDLEIMAQSIQEELNKKTNNVGGKGLSTNDFTNEFKAKLENLQNYDDKEVRDLISGVQNNLTNYYLKNETYNKTEVDNIIAQKQALIDKLEEENQKQQEELDILNSEYTEKELEGESVVVKDGLPKSKIKVKGNGNSYQETTEGYQLLDLIDGEYSSANGKVIVEKGICKVELNAGSTGVGVVVPLKNPLTIPTSETYTITNGINATYPYINLRSGNTNVISMSGSDKGIKSFSSETELSITGVYIYHNVATNIEFKPMLLKGSYTADTIPPFEKYTNGVATPNTNHKQDIEVIDTVNEFDTSEFVEEESFGITLTKGEDGTVILNGTSTGSTMFRILRTEKTILGTGKQALTINKLDGTITGGDLKFIAQDTDYGNLAYSQIGTAIINQKLINGVTYNIFAITITSGTVCNNLKLGLMISEITSPYLPYGHIGLSHLGENISEQLTPDRYDISGVNFKTTQKDVTLNGTSTSNVYQILYRKILPKGKYLCRGCSKGGSLTTYRLVFSIDGTNNNDIGNGIEIELTEEKTVEVGIWFANNQILNNLVFTPQIYADYELIPIDLAGEKLAKVGEIADLLNIGVDGSVSIEKKSKKDMLANINFNLVDNSSNSDTILRFNSAVSNALTVMTSANVPKTLLSNIFRCEYIGNAYKKECIAPHVTAKNQINIFIDKSRLATEDVEGLKAFLNEKGAYVFYILENAEPINLPSIEPITLFEGTNIFELVTNLGTTMAVTYKVSNKSRLEALEQAFLLKA